MYDQTSLVYLCFFRVIFGYSWAQVPQQKWSDGSSDQFGSCLFGILGIYGLKLPSKIGDDLSDTFVIHVLQTV